MLSCKLLLCTIASTAHLGPLHERSMHSCTASCRSARSHRPLVLEVSCTTSWYRHKSRRDVPVMVRSFRYLNFTETSCDSLSSTMMWEKQQCGKQRNRSKTLYSETQRLSIGRALHLHFRGMNYSGTHNFQRNLDV